METSVASVFLQSMLNVTNVASTAAMMTNDVAL